ncbi:MAG: hypothetical protein U1E53_33400 [Dongiaceae bacterium]
MAFEIALPRLQALAGQPDIELKSTRDRKLTTEQGSWGGRLMRQVKIALTDRTEKQRDVYQANLDVLHSLKQIYGNEIGSRAFRAGNGRLAADGGWEISTHTPLTGRQIAAMLAEGERGVGADGVAGLLAPRFANAATGDLVRRKLAELSQDDLLMIAKAVQAAPRGRITAEAEAQLVADLTDRRMGVAQALARNGLIGTDMRDRRGQQRLLTTGDREGLAYDSLADPGNNGRIIRGAEIRMEQHGGGFIHCTTEEYEREATGLRSEGDKLHLSVRPEDVGRAWTLVAPILYDNRDLFHEFKVTHMGKALAEHEKLVRQLPELEGEEERLTKQVEARRLGGGDTDEPLSRLEYRLAQVTDQVTRTRKEIAGSQRVLLSNQMTIYISARDGVDPGVRDRRIAAVVDGISTVLRESGIEPTKPDRSDLPIDTYCSYRRDKKPDGSALRPEDPDYETFKRNMTRLPLYQALTAPR